MQKRTLILKKYQTFLKSNKSKKYQKLKNQQKCKNVYKFQNQKFQKLKIVPKISKL